LRQGCNDRCGFEDLPEGFAVHLHVGAHEGIGEALNLPAARVDLEFHPLADKQGLEVWDARGVEFEGLNDAPLKVNLGGQGLGPVHHPLLFLGGLLDQIGDLRAGCGALRTDHPGQSVLDLHVPGQLLDLLKVERLFTQDSPITRDSVPHEMGVNVGAGIVVGDHHPLVVTAPTRQFLPDFEPCMGRKRLTFRVPETHMHNRVFAVGP